MKVAVIFALFSVAILVPYTSAFCIYNNAHDNISGEPATLWVRQSPLNAGRNYFSRFANFELKAGEKACCAYTNTDCVKSQDKDETIQIYLKVRYGDIDSSPHVVTMTGGGWMNYNGGYSGFNANGIGYVETFNSDGSVKPLDMWEDLQAGYA